MKRKRVERAVLIWPKESKKLGQEDEEIQPGSKIKKIISSLPNFAAGLVIITTLSAILSNVIIDLYDRGYSQYFGISDYLVSDRATFMFILIICITIISVGYFLGWLLSILFDSIIHAIVSMVSCYLGCYLFTSIIFNLDFLTNHKKLIIESNYFIIALFEFLIIFAFAFYRIPSNQVTIHKKHKRKHKYTIGMKYKKIIKEFILILIIPCLLVFLVWMITATSIISMNPNDNMFSKMGSDLAEIEARYKIASRDNKKYLLLKNTDNEHILMEIIGFGYDNDVLTYIAEKGKYQYINDSSDLQIQETHCKIKFIENLR